MGIIAELCISLSLVLVNSFVIALVASAQIKDGKLAFANLYMGRYYLVERATGLVLPIDGNGKLYVTGKYPQLNKKLERTGKYSTDEVAAQINGILHDIQTGESIKPNLQEQLEQTQQEFDRLLEMSLDFDEDTPFLDDRLKKLNNKIKSLKKAIEDSAARQEKLSQPEMLLSAKDLQIQEYDDALTARLIEKITVRSRKEIEIRFIGGYEKAMPLE